MICKASYKLEAESFDNCPNADNSDDTNVLHRQLEEWLCHLFEVFLALDFHLKLSQFSLRISAVYTII